MIAGRVVVEHVDGDHHAVVAGGDPRGVIVDTVWACRLARQAEATAADDIQAVAWHSLEEALRMDLAFDYGDSLRQFAETLKLA